MAESATRKNTLGPSLLIAGLVALLLVLTSAGRSSAEEQNGGGQDRTATASIGGTVSDQDSSPVSGVNVDLFTACRAPYLRSSSSGSDGTFAFTDLEPGCYVLTFVAPATASFAGGSDYLNADLCIAEGEVVTGADATVIDESGLAQITAEVRRRFSNAPVGGVTIDLFTSDESGERIEYLRSGRTGADGRGAAFSRLAPGCYTLTYIAPEGTSFNNNGPSEWFNQSVCVEAGEALVRSATLDGPVTTAAVRVILTDSESNGVPGVVVDLFLALGDGSRSTYLTSEATSPAGVAEFRIAPGCYIVVVIAPAGDAFPSGSPWDELSICLEANSVKTLITSLA